MLFPLRRPPRQLESATGPAFHGEPGGGAAGRTRRRHHTRAGSVLRVTLTVVTISHSDGYRLLLEVACTGGTGGHSWTHCRDQLGGSCAADACRLDGPDATVLEWAWRSYSVSRCLPTGIRERGRTRAVDITDTVRRRRFRPVGPIQFMRSAAVMDVTAFGGRDVVCCCCSSDRRRDSVIVIAATAGAMPPEHGCHARSDGR